MTKQIFLTLLFIFIITSVVSQTSDDQYKKPLKDVLEDVQKRFGIEIKYSEDMVREKWVTYADWRIRPDLDKTLSNILTPLDMSVNKTGEKSYKLKYFEYHRKTPEEGKEQLDYLATLYSDVDSWEKRKAELKQCMKEALKLSLLPAKLASLPIKTSKRKMNGYTIENIALETLPGLYVSGSLYVPVNTKSKMPVILSPDGHFNKGRYREDCQYRCAMLAKMGAMVFSYDLFAWGESALQFKPEDHRRSLAMTIQALNGFRILDYLLSLKGADPSRVAITGGSGGGSQTMLLTALDDRIKLSVPVVMLSSYHSGGCPCESGMPVHLCGRGTNNVEIASMAAPRPQLVISDGKDWTADVPEIEFPFLRRVYGFYSKSSNVENVHLEKEGHDYGKSKRLAMYEFIARHFSIDTKTLKDKAGNFDESSCTIEEESAMFVFGKNGERLPSNSIKNFEELSKVFEEASTSLRK